MSTLHLERIFSPKRIGVIGVGEDREGVGRTIFQNLIASGFDGPGYPLNLKRKAVQGVKAYASPKEFPDPVDLAIIATPAPTVPKVIEECGRSGIQGVIVISAGFGETGGI